MKAYALCIGACACASPTCCRGRAMGVLTVLLKSLVSRPNARLERRSGTCPAEPLWFLSPSGKSYLSYKAVSIQADSLSR
jgi:hypothetical protein